MVVPALENGLCRARAPAASLAHFVDRHTVPEAPRQVLALERQGELDGQVAALIEVEQVREELGR
jgi:hypothetical protein